MVCPICKKPVEWEDNLYRPFCSERCKLIDLGTWAGEGYKIEGDDDNDDIAPGKDGAEEKGGD